MNREYQLPGGEWEMTTNTNWQIFFFDKIRNPFWHVYVLPWWPGNVVCWKNRVNKTLNTVPFNLTSFLVNFRKQRRRSWLTPAHCRTVSSMILKNYIFLYTCWWSLQFLVSQKKVYRCRYYSVWIVPEADEIPALFSEDSCHIRILGLQMIAVAFPK